MLFVFLLLPLRNPWSALLAWDLKASNFLFQPPYQFAWLHFLMLDCMPLHFLDDAFSTACYLINRMPTPSFSNHSLFDTHFNCRPDYTFLWVFGCVCWPNLHPYNSNKFQPLSAQCLFFLLQPLS
jgi:hypothetical protein